MAFFICIDNKTKSMILFNFSKETAMNIKDETKYKEMLATCDTLNVSLPAYKQEGVQNAFRLIECHLREQFKYNYDDKVPAVALTRDNAVINSLIQKLESVCQKAKEEIINCKKTIEHINEGELKHNKLNGSYDFRYKIEVKTRIRQLKSFESVELMIQFIKQFVLPLPQGSKFPLIITGNINKIDDTEFKTYGGNLTGTVNATGQFNGSYTPMKTYQVKGDIHHIYLSLHDKFFDSFPAPYSMATMIQIYSKKTFNTDLNYDLEPGNHYVILECSPKETDPLLHSIVQAMIDVKHFGIWQAHARKNHNSVQGQYHKKSGFLKSLFGGDTNPYYPLNNQIKSFLEKELTQKRTRDAEEEKLESQMEEQHKQKVEEKFQADLKERYPKSST